MILLNFLGGVAVMSVDLGTEWMKIAIVSVCIFDYFLILSLLY